jgi:hypothetical protein
MNSTVEDIARKSQLAELYDRYHDGCMKAADFDLLDYEEIVAKFTRLIVEECAIVCLAQRDPKNVGYATDVKTAVAAMKQHFGI